MVQATVALRVDVDTRRGLDEGVPVLLELFRALDIRASFFVTMGPDRSGRAIRRALRPSFLVKMWRTNPFMLYGLRTLLSGTLLPSRLVGAGAAATLRRIAEEGHEVAPHGWDHVRWQDRIARLCGDRIQRELDLAVTAFHDVLGVAPHATAAPGWRTSSDALLTQERYGFRYASDTRGTEPFWPDVSNAVLRTVQLPTTMPTMDELLGRVSDVPRALADAVRPGLNVFTLHAEVEGGPLRDAFRRWLERIAANGVACARLGDVAARIERENTALPVAPIVQAHIDGRSGWISAQGPIRSRRSRAIGAVAGGGPALRGGQNPDRRPRSSQTAATSEGWT